VSWHAHGVTYCGQTPGSCPPPPTLIPVSKYTVGQWSAPAPPRMKCDLPEGGVPKFTVGMLARKETESLVNTLKTYEQEGFLQVGSHLKAEGTMCAMRSMLGLPFFPRGYHIRWLLWGLGCELNVCVCGGGGVLLGRTSIRFSRAPNDPHVHGSIIGARVQVADVPVFCLCDAVLVLNLLSAFLSSCCTSTTATRRRRLRLRSTHSPHSTSRCMRVIGAHGCRFGAPRCPHYAASRGFFVEKSVLLLWCVCRGDCAPVNR
jgi:hypothetical protein